MHFVELEASDPGLRELIAAHLSFAAENTAPGFAFAMDADALLEEGSRFYGVRNPAGDLLGIAALKPFAEGQVEIKSMHTIAAARRSGVASALLRGLLEAARAEGLQRVVLETGITDSFIAARRLYVNFGFEECPMLPQYEGSEHSVCMALDLS